MNINSIRFRLNALFILIVTTLLLAFGIFNYMKTKSEREVLMDRQVQHALVRLSTSLPSAVWNYDKKQIEEILNSEMAAGFVVGILINNGDKVLGGVGRKADEKIESISQPPAADDARSSELVFMENGSRHALGKATVYVSHAEINTSLRKDLLLLALQIAVLDIVIVFALSLSLVKVVLTPLASVRDALRDIASGDADLTKRLPGGNCNEFNDVASHFNVFISHLEAVMLQVRHSAGSLAAAATVLAASSQNVLRSTAQQSAVAVDIAAAVEETTVSVDKIAENAQEAQSISQNSGVLLEQGGQVVNETVDEMNIIAETVKKSAGHMDELEKQSEKIGFIVNAITQIAGQTNLLALNAAIEAARAGEHGRGFSIVADEVRKLAEHSRYSAEEIRGIIDNVRKGTAEVIKSLRDGVARVSQGVELAQRAGQSMGQVSAGASQVVQVINDISNALSEQSAASAAIAKNIERIAKATEENNAAAGQAASTAHDLERLSAALQKEINRFRVVS